MRKSAPKLQGYEGAIAANNSMAQAFGNVNKIANDWKGQEERARSNKVLEAYKQSRLDETKRTNDLNHIKYNDGLKEKEAAKNANAVMVKTMFPEQSSNIAMQYGDFPSKANANSMADAFKNIDIKALMKNRDFNTNVESDERNFNYKVGQDKIDNNFKQQQLNNQASNANKHSYTTFNGVDANGNPILKMIDKNTGKVVNTGQTVYQAPKQSTPEQAQYYNDRSTDMAIKTNAKAMEQLSTITGWEDLDTQSQKQALDYYLKNGIAPKIKGTGWFDGEPTLDIPLTDEQKAAKSKKLAEDMKALGL